MRKTFQFCKKSNFGSLTPYSRPDLTQKWLHRIQSKAQDQQGLEASNKLSSLVDYYSKNSGETNQKIDWDYWSQNIRTSGLVDKIKEKNESIEKQQYNIDTLAAKSAITSEKYENYGLFLKYNHALYMHQYSNNLKALYGYLNIGDVTMLSRNEQLSYYPGLKEKISGWRETGYVNLSKYYFTF